MHLSQLPPALDSLERGSRLRIPDDQLLRLQMEQGFGESFLDAASNDYLGAATQQVSSPQGSALPSGARASRLIFGSHPHHLEVESEVARWVSLDSALLFTSGYAANVGALAALLSAEDAVFSDALNHASLIDGIRLSRARPTIFEHLDLVELEEGLRAAHAAPARWVVVESYYSMDGDGPDLKALRSLCDRHDAHLYVDEAHSIGTFGTRGAGLCAEAQIRPDVLVAAFGKSVGAQGACVASSSVVRTWLWNRARSFVYSTGMSPALAQVLLQQIRFTQGAEGERRRLAQVSGRVREGLSGGGVEPPRGSFGPVLALVVGSAERASSIAERLRRRGILAQAVRPPTVAEGHSRLRVVLRASFSDGDCARLVTELRAALSAS